MDRLVIESVLSDVDEIHLSESTSEVPSGKSILLGFKAANTDQVIAAFSELKKMTKDKNVEFVICRTSVSGIYDLEIKTEALDEPIRIVNKAIPNDLLADIEAYLSSEDNLVLGTNVSEEENWIQLTAASIKECSVKES